jgi:hypothetical protein
LSCGGRYEVPAGHLPLTGLEVPGSDGVPVGLQSGPDVHAPFDEPCVPVCAGDTGAPPPEVALELDVVVCVTDVVALGGLLLVAVDVPAAPVVVDRVLGDAGLCLGVTVDDELWLDPPQAASPDASTTTAAATPATRARSPEHGVRCMT